jgi:hypothetical protein
MGPPPVLGVQPKNELFIENKRMSINNQTIFYRKLDKSGPAAWLNVFESKIIGFFNILASPGGSVDGHVLCPGQPLSGIAVAPYGCSG